MNTPKHTPGPWQASNTDGPWLPGGDDGLVEATTPDGLFIKREICHFFIDPDDEMTLAEDLANARLIAAAPDLAAACLAFNAALPEIGMHQQGLVRAWNMAARALDKALGETVCGHSVDGGDA